MIPEEWQPTPHLCFVNGVLKQKWTRKCVEYERREHWQPHAIRREWMEAEWRFIPNIATEPQTENQSC